MPPALRLCVHEFGYTVVNACLMAGVKEPRRIRQLVHEIWNGARQGRQRRRSVSPDGERKANQVSAHLDWLLIQSGSEITAETLVRVLWQSDLVIVPREPHGVMVEASMAEISNFNEVVTKHEKHRRRLRVGLDAAARRLWPHLFRDEKRPVP